MQQGPESQLNTSYTTEWPTVQMASDALTAAPRPTESLRNVVQLGILLHSEPPAPLF